MTQIARARLLAPLAALALLVAPLPLAAEEPPSADEPGLSEGAEMVSEGMKLLLKQLLAEGAEGWDKMIDWLDDLSQYDPPERLPNGDILIRRRPPTPGEDDPTPPSGTTDL